MLQVCVLVSRSCSFFDHVIIATSLRQPRHASSHNSETSAGLTGNFPTPAAGEASTVAEPSVPAEPPSSPPAAWELVSSCRPLTTDLSPLGPNRRDRLCTGSVSMVRRLWVSQYGPQAVLDQSAWTTGSGSVSMDHRLWVSQHGPQGLGQSAWTTGSRSVSMDHRLWVSQHGPQGLGQSAWTTDSGSVSMGRRRLWISQHGPQALGQSAWTTGSGSVSMDHRLWVSHSQINY